MCGRFDTSLLLWKDIYEQLSRWAPVRGDASNMLTGNDDVRPTTQQLVARLDGGEFELETMRWSMIPFFYKGRVKPSAPKAGDGFKLTTFNARVEPFLGGTDPKTGEPYKLPASFKGPFQRRRCIVPCSAWWEWKTLEDGKTKIKHRFARADGKPIWFAGLWETAQTVDEGEARSFTIMTGPSAGHLAEYHDRAPVILEPDEMMAWLDPSTDAKGLLQAVRPARFTVEKAT